MNVVPTWCPPEVSLRCHAPAMRRCAASPYEPRCSPARPCAACVDRADREMRDEARRRGQAWAHEVSRRARNSERWRDWPATEAMRAFARRQVADLAADEEVRAELAQLALEAARARWRDLQVDPTLKPGKSLVKRSCRR